VEIEGSTSAAGCRFAVIVSRFNAEITAGLLRGALAALRAAAVADADVTVVRVPGAFELPLTARHLAESGRFDAVIALGCVIKGDTMHFEYIAESVSHGLMHVSTSTRVPVAFGVLTTLNEQQAIERAGDGPGNKGQEAAAAAIEMATLMRRLPKGSA
jgi:6,7-dimethyl-8-ribityllumazine synthase